MFNVKVVGTPEGLASASNKIDAEPPQAARTESAVKGVEGITVLMVSITTVMGELSNVASSCTTTRYVPAVKSVGAGPNAPPSTENENGAVPQSTLVIENVPSAVPVHVSPTAVRSTFTSVMSMTSSTAALSVHATPVCVT